MSKCPSILCVDLELNALIRQDLRVCDNKVAIRLERRHFFFKIAFPQKLKPLLFRLFFFSSKRSSYMIWQNLESEIPLSDSTTLSIPTTNQREKFLSSPLPRSKHIMLVLILKLLKSLGTKMQSWVGNVSGHGVTSLVE